MKIKPEELYNILSSQGIDFFTGVPDSTIKYFCFYLEDDLPKSNHVIAANEGNSIAIATGYHLSTGKIPLVYMQNSGLGNAINPLTSLVDKELFAIPMLIMIGWRGEPGKKDAIQHLKDGRIQIDLLESLELPYTILPSENYDIESQISDSIKVAKESQSPYVILVRKNSFEPYYSKDSRTNPSSLMSREEAISGIIDQLTIDDVVISTTGKASRELHDLRNRSDSMNKGDFLVVGSMGHASSIALGVALQESERNIYCIDGDGALIMHMGALCTIGKYSTPNFRHILINNFSHESVGGQESSSDVTDYSELSKAVSYNNYFKISKMSEFQKIFRNFQKNIGPSFLEIVVAPGSRSDLSRPDFTPLENKKRFMEFLGY